MARRIQVVALLAVPFTLLACAALHQAPPQPEPAPRSFESMLALKRFGAMLLAHDVEAIRIQSKPIANETASKEVPAQVTTLLKTSVNAIGEKVVFVPYDPGYLVLDAAPSRPVVVIDGAISEHDQGVLKTMRRANATVGVDKLDAEAELGQESVESTLAVDLNLMRYENLEYLPQVQATNAVTLSEDRTSGGGGIAYHGTGVWLESALITKHGTHLALRTLVELSLLELLGKYFGVPYWRCVDGAPADMEMIARMRRTLATLGDEEFQLTLLKPYLFAHGAQVDVTTAALSPYERSVVEYYRRYYGVPDARELWVRLWSDLPFDGALAARTESRLREYQAIAKRSLTSFSTAELLAKARELAPYHHEILGRTIEEMEKAAREIVANTIETMKLEMRRQTEQGERRARAGG